MRINPYLVVDINGNCKVVKNNPGRINGEVIIPLRLDIPDVLFYPPEMPAISIEMDAEKLFDGDALRVVNASLEELQKVGVTAKLVEKGKSS